MVLSGLFGVFVLRFGLIGTLTGPAGAAEPPVVSTRGGNRKDTLHNAVGKRFEKLLTGLLQEGVIGPIGHKSDVCLCPELKRDNPAYGSFQPE